MSFRIVMDGKTHQVDIIARRPQLVVASDGRRITVEDPGAAEDGLNRMTVNGKAMTLARAQTANGLELRIGGRTISASLLVEGDSTNATASGEVLAPMPGAIVSVDASVGDTLKPGDPVLTIESMKLQMVLAAPRAGVVEEILVAEGEQFEKDQLLARLADESEGTSDA